MGRQVMEAGNDSGESFRDEESLMSSKVSKESVLRSGWEGGNGVGEPFGSVSTLGSVTDPSLALSPLLISNLGWKTGLFFRKAYYGLKGKKTRLGCRVQSSARQAQNLRLDTALAYVFLMTGLPHSACLCLLLYPQPQPWERLSTLGFTGRPEAGGRRGRF